MKLNAESKQTAFRRIVLQDAAGTEKSKAERLRPCGLRRWATGCQAPREVDSRGQESGSHSVCGPQCESAMGSSRQMPIWRLHVDSKRASVGSKQAGPCWIGLEASEGPGSACSFHILKRIVRNLCVEVVSFTRFGPCGLGSASHRRFHARIGWPKKFRGCFCLRVVRIPVCYAACDARESSVARAHRLIMACLASREW